MPRREPELRARDFREVALGFSAEQAAAEAGRCLQCEKEPCVAGCPVEVDIRRFVGLIAEGRFLEAAAVLKERNSLPAICGRVCPQETQCEARCALGRRGEPLAIGALERFAADAERAAAPAPTLGAADEGPKVAVVGSGPAGLTCAAGLARLGCQATIFESLHEPGGVLRYGIPEFRLPRAVLDAEIESVRRLGVRIETNVLVGKTLTLDELFEQGFQAVFLGTGAGLPDFLGLPGENLGGVYSANEFLTRVNLMEAYRFPECDTPVAIGRQAVVIGGGNTALDAARCARRLGAEVILLYRRTRREMPARAEEVENALEEGIELRELAAPLRFLDNGEGRLCGLEGQQMRLGEPDASGRRRPVPVPGSEFVLEADTAIIAVGQGPNPLLTRETPGLETARRGRLVVDPQTGATSRPGVFAGGDIANDAGTVIAAMGNGKRAARAIARYLGKRLPALPSGAVAAASQKKGGDS
jgi:glutamate synthase (NADPH/NADH) small chain